MSENRSSKKDMMRSFLRDDEESNIWVTEFDQDSVQEFYEKFMQWEANPMITTIPIYINSPGGVVYALTAKRDLIKTSVKPVSTIAVGAAMSCGASLLASGTKGARFASPDTRILIHQVSNMHRGKTSDIIEDARQTQSLNEMMLRNLAEDTGNSVAKFKNEIKNRENTDWTMTAEEALKWKLIDGIGIPRYIWSSAEGALQLFVDKKTRNNMIREHAAKQIATKPKRSR
jgi:ATP-dependent Clp endopeptidase proteolytic subunit ClpP